MEHTKSREVLWNALGTVNYVAAYYTESQQEAACKALSEAERYLTVKEEWIVFISAFRFKKMLS